MLCCSMSVVNAFLLLCCGVSTSVVVCISFQIQLLFLFSVVNVCIL